MPASQNVKQSRHSFDSSSVCSDVKNNYPNDVSAEKHQDNSFSVWDMMCSFINTYFLALCTLLDISKSKRLKQSLAKAGTKLLYRVYYNIYICVASV